MKDESLERVRKNVDLNRGEGAGAQQEGEEGDVVVDSTPSFIFTAVDGQHPAVTAGLYMVGAVFIGWRVKNMLKNVSAAYRARGNSSSSSSSSNAAVAAAAADARGQGSSARKPTHGKGSDCSSARGKKTGNANSRRARGRKGRRA